MGVLSEKPNPVETDSEGSPSEYRSLTNRLRNELRVAKQLLEYKSEIGRLPRSSRTANLLNLIEEWFDTPSG